MEKTYILLVILFHYCLSRELIGKVNETIIPVDCDVVIGQNESPITVCFLPGNNVCLISFQILQNQISILDRSSSSIIATIQNNEIGIGNLFGPNDFIGFDQTQNSGASVTTLIHPSQKSNQIGIWSILFELVDNQGRSIRQVSLIDAQYRQGVIFDDASGNVVAFLDGRVIVDPYSIETLSYLILNEDKTVIFPPGNGNQFDNSLMTSLPFQASDSQVYPEDAFHVRYFEFQGSSTCYTNLASDSKIIDLTIGQCYSTSLVAKANIFSDSTDAGFFQIASTSCDSYSTKTIQISQHRDSSCSDTAFIFIDLPKLQCFANIAYFICYNMY